MGTQCSRAVERFSQLGWGVCSLILHGRGERGGKIMRMGGKQLEGARAKADDRMERGKPLASDQTMGKSDLTPSSPGSGKDLREARCVRGKGGGKKEREKALPLLALDLPTFSHAVPKRKENSQSFFMHLSP